MLKVLKSGFYTTIQDQGRFGYREFGVPISGAMDSYSSRFANALLGNDANDAVIEMSMLGGRFEFTKPTYIAISGAQMNPKLNGESLRQNIAVQIKTNDILDFGRVKNGFRTYLAIKNGFKSNVVLGSRSQYMPITEKNTIKKNERIAYEIYEDKLGYLNASVKYNDAIFTSHTLEAYAAPEFNLLTKQQKDGLLNSELRVSKFNNRMAYQLEPALKNDLKPIITSPVLPGTVQLTPNGNLIILMCDCQTTGGYPRVLQLTEEAINMLSQKNSGSGLIFRLVN